MEIKLTFKTLYGKDLVDEVHGELSGNFRRIMKALLRSPASRDAYCLRKAMEGAWEHRDVLLGPGTPSSRHSAWLSSP